MRPTDPPVPTPADAPVTLPRCVFCREHPADLRWRPFCSERCKLLDLAAWAGGTYRVPGEPLPDPASPPREDSDD